SGPLSTSESTYTYDAAGNLTQLGMMTWLGGAAVYHGYDDAGRRTSSTVPHSLLVAETFDYDNLGRLIKVTDPLGLETDYSYDAAGNLIQVVKHDEFSSSGPTTTYAYDAANRL